MEAKQPGRAVQSMAVAVHIMKTLKQPERETADESRRAAAAVL